MNLSLSQQNKIKGNVLNNSFFNQKSPIKKENTPKANLNFFQIISIIILNSAIAKLSENLNMNEQTKSIFLEIKEQIESYKQPISLSKCFQLLISRYLLETQENQNQLLLIIEFFNQYGDLTEIIEFYLSLMNDKEIQIDQLEAFYQEMTFIDDFPIDFPFSIFSPETLHFKTKCIIELPHD
jgi:hypothetical protein